MENQLTVGGLKVVFPTEAGIVRAVEGIDLDVGRRECVAIVGESGCGKSVTSLAIMRLLGSPPALVDADALMFGGRELTALSDKELQDIRGKEMSIIFQDAMTALNPVAPIGRQIDEVYLRHTNLSKREAKAHTIHALRLVGVPSPERRYNDYPHQLSGGMRQRVLIAMAFACDPKLIIADEPTTALDVTIQAQVLDLIKNMQRGHGTSLILITHDLSVVAQMADTVYVMYSGKIVEKAPMRALFDNPLHPYTRGLLALVPRMSQKEGERLEQIPLQVPDPMEKPDGCYFHPRCKLATDICRERMPRLEDVGADRQVRCYHKEKPL
ncbi:MAG TPA: ABC transporter ATP-binding protein [Clostridia bacterium]|nr:ABC transporter ATP-binding protein [Clostridia bacterium]